MQAEEYRVHVSVDGQEIHRRHEELTYNVPIGIITSAVGISE